MKVFISWSGERSRAVAEALRDWLPLVIQAVKPWISARDIDKGTRWRSALAKQLEEAKFGIACVTKDNLEAPWLLFEAGALSKSVDESFVWTYLLDLSSSDLAGPLAEFQHTVANREDTKALVDTINRALKDNRLSEQVLETSFDAHWQSLQEKLQAIPESVEEPKPGRSDRELIEEILNLVRGLSKEGHSVLHGFYTHQPWTIEDPSAVVYSSSTPSWDISSGHAIPFSTSQPGPVLLYTPKRKEEETESEDSESPIEEEEE